MAYAKLENGLWYVYDTECSGVLSGPYKTESEAQAYCDEVNE